MKRIILSVLVLSMAVAVQAQEIPERKTDRPVRHERMKGRHGGGMDMKALNLTEEQKAQFKTQRETFRTQMEELKKNDGITVKESRMKMESLRKENKEKTEKILTTEQKAKLENIKTEGRAKHEAMGKERAARMKTQLGLSDEQAAKLEKSRTSMATNMKAIRENKSLNEEQKREQMKELGKKQKENMKSILTEEQMKKLKESGHKRMEGRKGKKEMNKTI